jgi:hypothetical protein
MCWFVPLGMALGASAASAAAVGAMATFSLAAGALSAVSSVQAGRSARQAGEYNAKVAENQAAVETFAGHDAAVRGADRAAMRIENSRRIAGAQVAKFGASGVDVTSGTPLDLLTETAGFGELDALTEINNARREQYGHDVGAVNARAQAGLDRFTGRASERTGYMNAGGTILGSVGQMYYNAKVPVFRTA